MLLPIKWLVQRRENEIGADRANLYWEGGAECLHQLCYIFWLAARLG